MHRYVIYDRRSGSHAIARESMHGPDMFFWNLFCYIDGQGWVFGNKLHPSC